MPPFEEKFKEVFREEHDEFTYINYERGAWFSLLIKPQTGDRFPLPWNHKFLEKKMASLGKTTGMKRDKRQARIEKKRAAKTRARLRRQKSEGSIVEALPPVSS